MSLAPARPTFEQLFGVAPAVRRSAPGRVNLIGEHTDYNGGFVLPVAIPQQALAEVHPRSGRTVEACSVDLPLEGDPATYVLGAEAPRGDWVDYVQGLTRVLTAEGHALTGFLLRVESTVPVGAGLSSSAALEIAILRALRDAFALELDDVALAMVGHRAETGFVGAPVGVMDQMACSLADEQHALFIDTRTLHVERVPLPRAAELIVIASGVTHAHATGGYRTRRAECDRAAELLQVPQLRDVRPGVPPPGGILPAPLDRRVRHVVSENQRVLDAVAALRAGDLRRVGALFAASHASMRDDFAVSVPEVDLLVSLAAADADIYGARLTGGGFGGAIVALGVKGRAAAAAARVAEQYAERSGLTPTILLPA